MDLSLYQKINSLPEELQKKVAELVNRLSKNKPPENKGVIFGLAKGKIKILDGFDDPIPGMEEYMK